jgi:PAS domain S-box-containing protein
MISVLYVDDERSLLDVGKNFLERSGTLTVFTAESASEALALVKEHHIDAIISDYQMPTMDGIDLLKAVRNTDPDLPFIFFSGKGTKEIVIEAFKHGADLYLQKHGEPKFLFEDLQHTVTEIVTLRNTERALHESEKLFREVFNNANDAIFLHEVNPEGPGKYIQVNDVTIRWLGYTRDEFLTMSPHDIVPEPVFSGVMPETMKRLIENGQATFESVHQRKDGSTYPVEVSTHIFMFNNRQVALSIVRDITERRKAEIALRKSEYRYRSLFEGVPIGLYRTTPSGQILDINPVLVHLLGYPNREMLMTVSVPDLYMNSGERNRWLAQIEREGIVRDFEVQLRKYDGTIIWVRDTGKAVRDDSGQAVYYNGNIEDITDIHRAEEEIQFKNVILSTQQETSLDGILVVDENGKILSFNRHFIELWGIPDDVIASQSDERVLQYVGDKLADPEAFVARVTYLYNHKNEESLEEILLKDGRILDRYSAPMVGQDKKYYGRVWYFRDITWRKRAEEALRASEQRYRDVVEDQTEFICRFLPDGRLTFINEAYCNYFRLNREECIGKRHSIVLPPDDTQQMKNHLAALTTENPVALISHRIVMPSGEVRWQRWSDRAIFDREGDVIEYQSVGRDITSQKEIETQLKNYKETLEQRVRDRTSELSETNLKLKKQIEDRKKIQKKLTLSSKEKDLLLREVHHRVKNNLQLIIGLIDMTKTRAHEPAVLSTLTDIMAKVQTMGSIHTRLYESKRFDKINMKRQVHDLVEMISGFCDHDHLDITTNINCAEIYLPVDQAIPCALALNEIISNIHKHAFSGRRSGLVEISSSKKADKLRFVVRDNGVGLPSGFDIEKSNRLGLKLMRTLVEQQLHGNVQITSKAGTEVVIEFPINLGESDYGTGTGS